MIAHKNWKAPTVSESDRIDRMLLLGCTFCIVLGIPNFRFIECHHIVEGNRRLGHLYTLPLCRGHHREEWEPDQVLNLEVKELVAISSGSKAFIPIYGTERYHWEKIQVLLNRPEVWPVSKRVARRVA